MKVTHQNDSPSDKASGHDCQRQSTWLHTKYLVKRLAPGPGEKKERRSRAQA